MHPLIRTCRLLLLAALALPATAHANILLSRVLIDIGPGADTAQNIEITNDGNEVAYVVVEPSEVISPGLPQEKRVAIVDPGVGGLLVSPQRLILQPQERKVIRIAAIAPRGPAERIYRVIVKPVSGPVTAQVSALKLLVGYDALVVFRPVAPVGKLVGSRSGNILTLRNDGNTNVEIFEGKQCNGPKACTDLPSKRIYAGQSWQQELGGSAPVSYRVAMGASSAVQQF